MVPLYRRQEAAVAKACSPRSSVRVLMREEAAGVGGRAVVVHVQPDVRRVLHPVLDGERLVVGLRLVAAGVAVGDRRPHHRRPLHRRHDDAEVVELGAAARRRRREVHEESVDARALRRVPQAGPRET